MVCGGVCVIGCCLVVLWNGGCDLVMVWCWVVLCLVGCLWFWLLFFSGSSLIWCCFDWVWWNWLCMWWCLGLVFCCVRNGFLLVGMMDVVGCCCLVLGWWCCGFLFWLVWWCWCFLVWIGWIVWLFLFVVLVWFCVDVVGCWVIGW